MTGAEMILILTRFMNAMRERNEKNIPSNNINSIVLDIEEIFLALSIDFDNIVNVKLQVSLSC